MVTEIVNFQLKFIFISTFWWKKKVKENEQFSQRMLKFCGLDDRKCYLFFMGK